MSVNVCLTFEMTSGEHELTVGIPGFIQFNLKSSV